MNESDEKLRQLIAENIAYYRKLNGDTQAGLAVFLGFHKEKPRGCVCPVLDEGQPLGLQPVGPQHIQHFGQPLRPVAQRKAPAVLQKAERTLAHIVQRAGVLVPGKGVGGVLALRPLGKIRGIARAHVKLPLVLPPCAQVGTGGGDVGELLLFHRCCQQGAALGLQFQRGAGAAVPGVVPNE